MGIMQQAYRVIRVVAEAQTIRIALASSLSTQALRELRSACAAFNADSSSEVKAVVLDFGAGVGAAGNKDETVVQEDVKQACVAVQAVAQPVLAVVRGVLTTEASALAQSADLLLMAHNAALALPTMGKDAGGKESYEIITGTQAIRNKYTTWSVAASDIPTEIERILDMLREQSAVALRYAKASINIGTQPTQQAITDEQTESAIRLEALRAVNAFYLTHVMQTADAAEGLQAFLAKRKPQWNNR
jgi:enoyl-CoA hydratase/carnithine racemase